MPNSSNRHNSLNLSDKVLGSLESHDLLFCEDTWHSFQGNRLKRLKFVEFLG